MFRCKWYKMNSNQLCCAWAGAEACGPYSEVDSGSKLCHVTPGGCEGAGQAALWLELYYLYGVSVASLTLARKKQHTPSASEPPLLASDAGAEGSPAQFLLQVPAQMQAHDTSARGPGARTSEMLCDGLEARGGGVNKPGCVVRTFPCTCGELSYTVTHACRFYCAIQHCKSH